MLVGNQCGKHEYLHQSDAQSSNSRIVFEVVIVDSCDRGSDKEETKGKVDKADKVCPHLGRSRTRVRACAAHAKQASDLEVEVVAAPAGEAALQDTESMPQCQQDASGSKDSG